MAKFCCVLFSYNRAMLLDLTLRSLTEKMVPSSIRYYVIYHCSAAHHDSYAVLKEHWQDKGVTFWLRDEQPRSFWQLANLLVRPRNLYRYLRNPKMRGRIDNFKALVEGAIRHSGAPFTFFSTDDQYVIAPTYLPQVVLEQIQADPRGHSFRMGLSDRFSGRETLPENLKLDKRPYSEGDRSGTLLYWHADDPAASKFWEYSFNVDFQLFDSHALLEFLAPMLYHMPTTLEAFGVKESRRRGYFRHLIGTCERTVIGVQANNVQSLANNPAMNYSPDLLKDLYARGYRLAISDAQLPREQFLFLPEQLFFYQEDDPAMQLFEFAELTGESAPPP